MIRNIKQLIVLSFLGLIPMLGMAQNGGITLRFTGQSTKGAYVRTDSIQITNTTQGWGLTLHYPDTVLNLETGTGVGLVEAQGFGLRNVRPNPFDGSTTFEVYMPQAGALQLQLVDLNGRALVALDETLTGGVHSCRAELRAPGTYLLSAVSAMGSASVKLVNQGYSGRNAIEIAGKPTMSLAPMPQIAQALPGGLRLATSGKPYSKGDKFRFTGYATIEDQTYTSETIAQKISQSLDLVLKFAIDPPANVPVTGVSLNKSTLTLIEGASGTLVATIAPANASDQGVTWASDATEIATVDAVGKVTAVKAGTANITVTTNDGDFTATCAVTVTEPPTPLTFTVGTGAEAVSFKMIPVAGGTFQMGSDSVANQKPAHQVTLSDYYMGETEVTQALWQAVTGQSPTSDGYQWDSIRGLGDNYPAYWVSWNDICLAGGFLQKLNAALATELNGMHFALPTEAQWEFAARGGNLSQGYTYAGSNTIDDVAWYTDNSGSTTHEVGNKAPNELSIYDMTGNVWEWCSDWYGAYGAGPDTDPTGPTSGTYRDSRGGAYGSNTKSCEVLSRQGFKPDDRPYGYGVGFRLVLSYPPANVPVLDVSVNKPTLILIEGTSETLVATVTPDYATNQNVTWTCDNPEVATVDDEGKVTTVAPGTANVVVTTEDGNYTATCKVKVLPAATLTFTVGEGKSAVTFYMLPVEAGTFQMGCDTLDYQKPAHQVTLTQDYWLGEFEVTQGLWEVVMDSVWPGAPNHVPHDSYGKGADYAAYFLSWNDICGPDGFLEKLNAALATELAGKSFVLPTEAQWEFAARGGNQSHGYMYAGSNIKEDVAASKQKVGAKAPNELGFYDMTGGVHEWCADWYGNYGAGPDTDPTGPTTGDKRVCRGGNRYFDNTYYAGTSTVSQRGSRAPDERRTPDIHRHDFGNGFRLALTPPATVSVTGVSLNKTEISIAEGGSETLTAIVTPDEATDKGVTWASDKTEIATVNETGKVTAVKAGTANITVTTNDGDFTATCVVTVIEPLKFTVGEVTFNMMPVEAGTFQMGSDDGYSSEQPVHSITLTQDYWMGEFEVTQGLWKAVMGSNPSNFQSGDNYPVEKVSWDNICGTDGFLEKLNTMLADQLGGKLFALPTEAQWEFAARGGKLSHGYTYSGGNTADDVASSGSQTHEVGGKAANELGIYDMSGNVWEWCADWYGDYGTGPDTDPTGPATGTYRVIRGGSWSYTGHDFRVSSRSFAGGPTWSLPSGCDSGLGFRLALNSPATVSVTGVSLNKTEISIAEGGSETLTATVTPEEATDKSVTWSSDATDIATVDETCKVTAIKAGTANITVTTNDGNFTATCVVTVIEPLTFTVGEGENAVTFNMIPVEAGTFQMGEAGSTHQVTLTQDYWMGEFEVTQGLWEAVMGSNPSKSQKGDNYPVEKVSWNDVQSFLTALNTALAAELAGKSFVLPTEAQWEFAARGGNSSSGYTYAGSNTLDDVAWYQNNSGEVTQEVGGKAANELGIFDMSGNVCEWCSDRWATYPTEPVTDPTGPETGTSRVLRGGCMEFSADLCTVSYRQINNSPTDDYRDYRYGLRLALVVLP